MTGGLDTKKKIVARYGDGAAFERGKPLPQAIAARRSAPPRDAAVARVVRAEPPVIRRAAR